MQYSLDEIVICGSSQPVDLEHRGDINPYDNEGKLPIFVSPMTCVIDKNNYEIFKKSKVIPILPRNCDYPYAKEDWIGLSLPEFEYLIEDELDLNGYHVLVDIANGHMEKIYKLAKQAKEKFPELVLMVGNIAHEGMYRYCCEAKIDYVRVSVGSGSACSTSCLTGVHRSLPTLLMGINNIKTELDKTDVKFRTKIVADGGLNTIDKAIKCLALGADYVMMGNTFARCEEACGKILYNKDGIDYREYYGMASERGQIDISGGVTKEPEGVEIVVPVTYTLDKFIKKFTQALRSAMSYTGHMTLKDFRKSIIDIQSISEFNSYYKND